ncbi:creatininase family protein [Marinilabilia sp.]
MKTTLIFVALIALNGLSIQSQEKSKTNIPVKIEELTAPQFETALEKSASTCIIPLGVLEKHGPHMPLGTDVFIAREIALRAAKKEYVPVFPFFYFGQIFEAKHQPGTFAYSNELIWRLLSETCQELARNGFKKIILVNGHGGNNDFLPYFCQSQLAKQKDYAVVLFQPQITEKVREKIQNLKQTDVDMHAGENETSMLNSFRSDLVHPNKAQDETGKDEERMTDMPYGYTGIWWHGRFPNHYGGDGSNPNDELGELILDHRADQLVELIKYLKQNSEVLNLQDDFFEKTQH